MLTQTEKTELMARYAKTAWIIAFGIAKLRDMNGDDLLGPAYDGLIRAVDLVNETRSEIEIENFIKKVVRNEVKDYIRKEHKHRSVHTDLDVRIVDSKENIIIARDEIRKKIKKLPHKYHDVFMLKLEEPDISVAEICLYLNLTTAGVQNILQEGRKLLKNNH